jgi:hypothetical protein
MLMASNYFGYFGGRNVNIKKSAFFSKSPTNSINHASNPLQRNSCGIKKAAYDS